ncbi:Protein of unknown function [Chitinophaga sp. YR627]|uniref:DUF3037 domain-containing protein n=1 Tax=Chitinophaga sp. YR627 TaxID=1881041 RepID=UPI0008E9B7B9|nr:DUF3037 domain-containing protein [Chitinophaga sp. YR627]SFN18735.1 Protein of unknown function [Chitinophaga sp. YR627]
MTTYQYQILRFLPDRVSGEFMNVGIIIFDPKNQILKGRFLSKLTRINALFPSVHAKHLTRTLRFIQSEINRISQGMTSEIQFENIENVDKITGAIIAKDDSALFFTEPQKLLDVNIDAVVSYLYDRMILHHESEEIHDTLKDKEVWSKIYKEYFDSFGISSHLHNHTIVTNSDKLEFDKAWKNGKWNCFEPVSFDLSKTDSIKNKVYKWAGKIDELKTSREPMHLYLLSVFPKEENDLKQFIWDKLGKFKDGQIEVDLITKDNIVNFAKKIKEEIEQHEKPIN